MTTAAYGWIFLSILIASYFAVIAFNRIFWNFLWKSKDLDYTTKREVERMIKSGYPSNEISEYILKQKAKVRIDT